MERAGSRVPRSSAHLGLALRRVLLNPAAGFDAMLAARKRRERTGAGLSEGVAPYVFSATGGATAMLLWLKLGGLMGLRQIAPEEVSPLSLLASLVMGAVVMLVAQSSWAWIGGRARGRDGDRAGSADLRMLWGVAAFPQVGSLLLLFPLDILIGGPAAYGTTRPPDPVAQGWAAISIAFGVALAAWSLYLFFAGLRTATDGDARTTGGLLLVALLCVAATVAAFSVALLALAGATS
jgi:hypothetical protein